ncbi:MAG: short-chain dehydrogenase [Gammaproteobacteria bacterium]|nr:short-chain dehydrogenase [Gammaproteobacteria bacterium]|tara:strand:- start:1401 stop:2177 length:777 start_codon:yes stop_codon:yes gene_type:complete
MTKSVSERFDLSGKVAIVTGGSRGLGLEMCKAFAACGANVVIASRKAEPCEEAARAITEVTGIECVGVAFHAGNWSDADRLVDFAYDKFGHVDVLVNNAGMSPLYESLTSVTEELYDKVMQVNLRGPFRLASLVGERMAAGNGGSIINVSSTAAVQPTPNELPYATAKAGLNALTLGLARAFGPKVRANCIMPGPFLTDISKAWDMEAFNERAQLMPLQRGGEPDEVVGAALYFASDASSFTTGAVLKIDGGSAWTPG